jgi:hypothetical protein
MNQQKLMAMGIALGATGRPLPKALTKRLSPAQLRQLVNLIVLLRQQRQFNRSGQVPVTPELQQQAKTLAAFGGPQASANPTPEQVLQTLPPAERARVLANEAQQIQQTQAQQSVNQRGQIAQQRQGNVPL